ncbi:MAG: Rieske 2Fe-2S domain-containing protein, partial [Pseudomonadales bacterium]
MSPSVNSLIEAYDPTTPLSQASTPPSGWYTDSRIDALEAQRVFASSWQLVARVEQLENNGQFVSTDVAGEPILIVRDGELRAFYNVCRHHAARVVAYGD